MTVPLITAEIDLSAIAHNIKAFKTLTPDTVKIMPAVKADGYGHGAVAVSKIALENGADALGVARIEEGISLRNAGIDAPILVFGYTSPVNAKEVIDHDLTITVSQFDIATQISDSAKNMGKKIKIHFKIDSGMGRIGLFTHAGHPDCPGPDNSGLNDIREISKMAGLELEGVYTHFAQADHKDKAYTNRQFEIFTGFTNDLKKAGLEIPVLHAANSAAAIEMPETHLDMIRPGISFYGLYPSDEVDSSLIDLKPAMQLKAKIISLKTVPKGFKISYGSTHVTEKQTTIAVVPVGYADGFSRLFTSNGSMLVHGQRAPIVGRVCMDLTMIDVGGIPDVRLDDEVVIFGEQGENCIRVEELAKRVDTINYEIVSSLTARVPRTYR